MVLPIYAYGNSVLLEKAKIISPQYPKLKILIQNMWDTLDNSGGIGLAAPQIGLSVRIFLVNTLYKEKFQDGFKGIKQVFINPIITEELGELCSMEEGCLSIPNISGYIERLETVRLKYLDENFKEQESFFHGLNARVIQHEYDHLEGILFINKLKPIKKRQIKKRLKEVREGKVIPRFEMIFKSKKS